MLNNKRFPPMEKRTFEDLEYALLCGMIPTHIKESEWNELVKKYGNNFYIDLVYAKFYRGAFTMQYNGENIYELIKE